MTDPFSGPAFRPAIINISIKAHPRDKLTRCQDPYELVISNADFATTLEGAVLNERAARLNLPESWSWVMAEHGKRRARVDGALIQQYTCDHCAGKYPTLHVHPLPCEEHQWPLDGCSCLRCSVAGARGIEAP